MLPLRPEYVEYGAGDKTNGFRITPDSVAKKVIDDWFIKNNTPLTATSANLSGLAAQPTVSEILAQFGVRSNLITTVINDGARSGLPSKVVRVHDDGTVTVIRESAIKASDIKNAVT